MTQIDGEKVLKLTDEAFLPDPSLPIKVCYRDPQPVFPLHYHTFDELVIVFKGTALHVIDDMTFPLKAGDVFVITGNRKHQYRDMKNLVLVNILFDAKKLDMLHWDIRALPGYHALFALEPAFRARHRFQSRLQLTEPQLNCANELVRELDRETTEKCPGYRVMAKGLFMQLAVYLSRCYSDKPNEESRNLLRLGDAIAYIETHFANRITILDLAKKAHMSPRHFQRVFRQCMHKSPVDYLLHVRIRHASGLLRNTDRSITEIAYDCGFTDSNYFTRCFRKVMNITPKQYRQRRSE